MEGSSSSTEHRPMSPGPAGVKATVTATGLLPGATGAGGVSGGSHGGKALAPTITFSTKGVHGMVHGAGETIRGSSSRSSSMDSTHDGPEHQGHDLLLLASSSSSSFLRAKGQQQQQQRQQQSELEEGEIAQEQNDDGADAMDVVRPAGRASTISTPVKDAMSSSPSSSSLGTPCPSSPTAAGAPADAAAMRAAAAASPPPASTHQRQSSAVGEAAQLPSLPRLHLPQQQGASKPHAAKSPTSLLAGLKEAEREAACVLRTLSASSSSSACDSPASLAASPFGGPRWAQPPATQQPLLLQPTIAAARPEPSSESLDSAATKQSRWQAMLEEGEADSDEDDKVIVMLHPDEQRRLQQKQQQRRRPGSAFSLSSASGSESEDDSDASVAEQAGAGSYSGSGSGGKKPFPTRKERRLLRQRDRAYHDPWQRIGYYKRCAEKYGAGAEAQYDSEDSEHEGREEADPQLLQQLASPGLSHAAASQYIRGTAGPFATDFAEVRTTMLKIDALAAAAASVAAARGGGGGSSSGGAPPKYLREWGKKVRRRDAAALLKQQLKEQQQSLQQRIRRERSRGGGGADGGEEQEAGLGSPFSAKGGRERAGSFAGSVGGGNGCGSASFPGSPFSVPGSALSVASSSAASSPQRSPGKKEKGPGSSGKRGGGGCCSKRFRIPGMPAPKRQSTALSLSYEKQADGLIKCRRCGKPNFKNEFALRSHLSHCPGTIQMKEQRIKVEAGLLAPESVSVPAFADDGTGQLPAWVPNFSASSSNSNLSAQDSSRSCDGGHSSSFSSPGGSPSKPPKHTRLPSSASSSGASSHAPPPHYAHALAPAPFLHGAVTADAASPALPSPLAIARQQSDSSYTSGSGSGGPASPAPVFEGTPLVGSALGDGDRLVGCTVAYKPRDAEEWVDVRVKNYRSRRNTHLVVYPDTSVEWVVLTDRNCRLPPGLSGPQEQETGADGERASAAASSTGSVADSAASSALARNAFFFEQEALLASARNGSGSVKRKASDGGQEALLASARNGSGSAKRKASDGGDGGSSVASSVSNGRFAFAAQPQPLQQQPAASATITTAAEEGDEQAAQAKAMKMEPAASPAISPSPYPHAHAHAHHPHHAYAHPHAAAFSMVHGPPSGAGHLSALASQFACRRCLQTFHNKQALGWHTRKGCHGIAHLTGGNDSGSSPSSSSAGSYALPPPPPAMPIMHGYMPGPYGQPPQHQHHGMVPPPPSPPMHYYAPGYHGGRGF